MSLDESCFIKNEGEVTFFFNRRDHREGTEDTEDIKKLCVLCASFASSAVKKNTADLFVFFTLLTAEITEKAPRTQRI